MSSRGTEHKTVLQDITITSEPIRKVTNSTEFQKENRSGTRQKEIAAKSRDRAGHEIPHNLSTTNTHTSTTTKQLAEYVFSTSQTSLWHYWAGILLGGCLCACNCVKLAMRVTSINNQITGRITVFLFNWRVCVSDKVMLCELQCKVCGVARDIMLLWKIVVQGINIPV